MIQPLAVVQFSGGVSSWAAARRTVERYGRENVTLLFADTLIEDEDLYRFLIEAAADVYSIPLADVKPLAAQALTLPPVEADRWDVRVETLWRIRGALWPIVPGLRWIAEGRQPWEVFRDQRIIGNSRIDPCSQRLKREKCDRWHAEHAPEAVTVLGLDWTEDHRVVRSVAAFERKGRKAWCPMAEPPLVWKNDLLAQLRERGIEPPRLYRMGFPHNNCGGFCIKAGQGAFGLLLRELPARYAWHEAQEESLRAIVGDHSVMRDRTGGQDSVLTMRQFRERTHAGMLFDPYELGGCGCFTAEEPAK